MNSDRLPPDDHSDDGEQGPEASRKQEDRITRKAREVAQASRRRYKAEVEGGKLGGWFGTVHQLANILAIVVIGLLLLLACSIIGAVYWHDMDYFQTIGVPLLGSLGTIIGYLIGQNRRSRSRNADE